jgi:hypothetical protein
MKISVEEAGILLELDEFVGIFEKLPNLRYIRVMYITKAHTNGLG